MLNHASLSGVTGRYVNDARTWIFILTSTACQLYTMLAATQSLTFELYY